MIKKVFTAHNYDPGFAYIVVSKRINQRFFGLKNGVKPGESPTYVNPPAGTVVDDVVTLPERYVSRHIPILYISILYRESRIWNALK